MSAVRNYLSIESKTTIRLLLRLLVGLLVGSVIFYVCYMTAESSQYVGKMRTMTYVFGGLVWLFFIYKIGVFRLLLEREWKGEIIGLELRNGWYSTSLIPTRSTIRPTVYIHLTVMTSGGKKKRVSYNTVHITPVYYSVGMKVVHKRGARFLVYKTAPADKIICPVCTRTLDRHSCPRCRISF